MYFVIMFQSTIIILCGTIKVVTSLFESCDQTLNLLAGETKSIDSPYYPDYQYPPGTSCRYLVKAPSGYEIQLQCTITMPKNVDDSCESDFFFVNKNGLKSLEGSEYFCGSVVVEKMSLFNQIMFAYASYTETKSGTFACRVTAQQQTTCDCGWTISGRIVGGDESLINEFSPMVGVIYLPGNQLIMGGTIIHYHYVLTAAHGLVSYTNSPNVIGVLIGDHDYSIGTETPFSEMYNVKTILIHEGYRSATETNDIAILRLTSDIIYSLAVGPACLPFNLASDLTGNTVDVAGWGTTSFGDPVSNVLRKVTLDVISNAQCQTSMNVQSSQICTYTPNKDTCQYDSGGSLYLRSRGLYTVGIVSHGVKCALSTPSVNTRVSVYLDWIRLMTSDANYCVK